MMTRMPTARVWYSTSSPASDESVAEHADDEGADQAAPQHAAAAEQAGAADDDGGDRVEVGIDAGVRTGRVDASHQDPAGQRERGAGGDVDAQQHAPHRDAGEPRGLGVITHGVDVPAPGGLAQRERHHDVQPDHHQDAGGDADVAERDHGSGPRHQLGHVGSSHARAGGVQQHQRREHVERAERDDERWQLEPGDEDAVEQAGGDAHPEPDHERERAGQTVHRRRLRTDHRRQQHQRADGEVDAGGQDDERLPDGECADHRDLLDDEREVLRGEESVVEDREHDHRDDQHQRRAQRRVAVQQVVDALSDRGALAVLGEDLGHGGSLLTADGWRGEGHARPRMVERGKGMGGGTGRNRPAARWGQPQQMDFALSVSMLSTPSCGSPVTSATPVS